MIGSTKSKNTAQELNLKIKQHLEELAKETDKAWRSEEMVRYLNFCAKFHQYSPSNIWLILMARPGASHVAGYTAWKKMGRYVKKGEKGIPIFAPMLYRGDPDNEDSPKVLRGFRIVYVFDISQTGGDPLPEQPDWKSPEKNLELNKQVVKFADSKGIKVTFKELTGDIQGVSKGGEIEVATSAGTKTLIHEIAHELLHQETLNFQNTALKELQAEAVSFVVSRYFGLEALKSPNYIALHGATSEEIYAHMEIIRNTANEIITALPPLLEILNFI